MPGFDYRYNDPPEPRPETQQREAEYVQALQLQHATVVDELMSRHLLWMPEMFFPMIDAIGVIRTIIRLRDGRERDVVTSSTTGETTTSKWRHQP